MKENKEHQIKCRITASQKEQLENYCAAAGLSISAAMRLAITELLNGGNEHDKRKNYLQ